MNTPRPGIDETLRETVQHGSSSYPFAFYDDYIWECDFHCVDWHWHRELEFILVSKGSTLCLVGAERAELPEGWGMFINSGTLHRYEARSENYSPNIVFSPELLASEGSLIYEEYIYPVIASAVPYLVLSPEISWQKQALDLLKQVVSIQEAGGKRELCTTGLLLQIWDILVSHTDFTPDALGPHRMSHTQARLQTMMQYIHDQYKTDLTLEKIAASASISKSGALQIFQSAIHTSPVAYLIQYRLAQAAEQLSTTQKPVSSIAEETGFMSCGYFCRKFKEHYHMSPNAYRRMKA